MLTLADLGVLRDVSEEIGRRVVVRSRRPTPAAPPWTRCATTCVRTRCTAAGYADVEVRTVLRPPGPPTGSPSGRRKLAEPASRRPGRHRGHARPGAADAVRHPQRGACPLCGSADTEETSRSAPPPARRCGAAGTAASRSSTSRRSDAVPTTRGAAPGSTRCGWPPSSGCATTPSPSPSTCRPSWPRSSPSGPASRSPCAARWTGGTSAARTRSARRPGARPRIGVREVPAACSPAGWCTRCGPATPSSVAPPTGAFTPDLTTAGHHVLIAAGSGITPVLSIAASVLAADDRSRSRCCTATGAPTR
jgi:hypothetical protein